MPYDINDTHDPKLESWVESANDPDTDFPIQNLPICEFVGPDDGEGLGIRIGAQVLDIGAAARSGMLVHPGLNLAEMIEEAAWGFDVLSRLSRRSYELRKSIQRLLLRDAAEVRQEEVALSGARQRRGGD